jgi:hypothetical protein
MAKKLVLGQEALRNLARALLSPAPSPTPKLLAAKERAKQWFTT